MNPEIIYEDTSILVCKKPAGVPTQSANAQIPDMESILKKYLVQKSPGKTPYLGIIHRLDQPVEGILVFAKTPDSAKELNRQLTSGKFQKYYYALLSSYPPQEKGSLEHYLVKDGRTNTSRVCAKETPGAKKALLEYQLLSKPDVLPCLCEITLKTGRHHQIRVQFSFIGCALAGDRKYGTASEHYNVPSLCAHALRFYHPKTKELLSFHYTPEFAASYFISN